MYVVHILVCNGILYSITVCVGGSNNVQYILQVWCMWEYFKEFVKEIGYNLMIVILEKVGHFNCNMKILKQRNDYMQGWLLILFWCENTFW